ADGVGVFLSIQTVQRHASGFRMGLGRTVEVALHPGHEGFHFGGGRLLVPRGRHEAAAELAYGVLPDFRFLRDPLRSERVEGYASGPVLGVVALAAVGLEKRPALLVTLRG